jgi:signal transduction histidine kinase
MVGFISLLLLPKSPQRAPLLQLFSSAIQDQGKGITAEKLAALKAQRTGVGITGMRERIRYFNGEMDIQSNGTGATIIVTFPLPEGAASGPAAMLYSSGALDSRRSNFEQS